MTRHPVHRPRPRRSALILALIACWIVAPFAAPAAPAHAAGTIYVDANASGANDGSSWADAYTTLQAALAAASSGTDIWVAQGTYTPGISRGDTFQLVNDVEIYGGFTSGDTQLSDRDPDPATNGTILSGDIDGNDTPNFGNRGGNSYHVVTGSGTDSTAELNGFTVTAGNADDGGSSCPNNCGGGVYNNGGSPTLTNVTISGNQATNEGGGMSNNSNSSPVLTNVTISGNRTTANGGGMSNDGGSPTLTNVTISGNQATNSGGGGMFNTDSSSPVLTNVTISGNRAGSDGGGMFNTDSSSPVLTNVTISGNRADLDGGGMSNRNSSSPVLTNVTISGNRADFGGGGGMSNSNSILTSSSPTLTNVTISGNQATNGGGMYNEFSSSPVLTNVTISGNQADRDGGGMSNDGGSNPTIQNSIIWGNDAPANPQVINSGSTPSYTNSLVQGESVGGFTGSEDPLFANPQAASSAPTTAGDYRLLPGSSAIDTGDNTADPDPNNSPPDTMNDIATDLDGNPRIVDGTVDLGAYEAPAFTLTAVSGNNQQTSVGTVFSTPLVVSVAVSDTTTYPGYPLEGGSVTFAGPATGASTDPQTNTVTIDSSAQASVSITANDTPGGPYTVSASTSGSADTVDFSLTNLTEVVSITRADSSPTNTASVTFTVVFSDNVTGVDTNNFSLNTSGTSGNIDSVTGSGDTWTVTVDSISGDGTLRLDMVNDTGVDPGVGNLPFTGEAYTIDTTAPAAPTVSGTTPTSDTLHTWTWTGDGSAGSGTYRYKLDDSDLSSGATETTATSYTPASALADGSHTLYVQEQDAAGNWSSSGSFTILVDTTPPTVTIDSGPPDPSGSTEASISFSGADGTGSGIAGYACQLDGGAWETCSSPASYTGLGDGEHTVTVRATDNVGNSSSASHTWTIDTALPAVSIDRAPPALTSSTDASISFTATDSDGIASLECQLNAGAWEPCSSPVSYTDLRDGEHTVTIRATDTVGNTASASHTWTVDSTAPAEPTITSDLTTLDRTPVISGTAEAGVTVTLTLDLGDGTSMTYETTADEEGNWSIDTDSDTPVSGTLPPEGLPVGVYPLTGTATDAAGNDATRADTLTIASPDEPAADARTIYLPLIQRAAPPPPARECRMQNAELNACTYPMFYSSFHSPFCILNSPLFLGQHAPQPRPAEL